jgi:monofunctional glycosyltransferase
MKQFSKKQISLSLLVFLALFSVGTLTYAFFSNDVSLLVKEYPHNISPDPLVSKFEIKPQKPKDWLRLQDISSNLKWAIVLSEDWGFYQHEGVDFNQLQIAINEGLEDKKLRGASTITQQMVKNVYLSQSRSYLRKIHEMILTYQVEKVLHKQRILEIYLNCIEFGPGVYGIKKASSYYFKKPASSLTPRESAFIAMLLPSPKKYSISFRKKSLTRFARTRVKAILRKMRMAKIISADQFNSEVEQKFSWEY